MWHPVAFVSRALNLLKTKPTNKPWKKKPVRLDFEQLELRWLPAAFSLGSASGWSVGESTRYIDVDVTRDTIFGSASVDYRINAGSATAGSDYTAVSGTLNFNTLEATKTVRVPIIFDQDSESNETFDFEIYNPSSPYTVPSPATVTINNSSVTTWTVTGGQRVTDPLQGDRLPFGSASIGLQAGDFSVSHGFDYGRGAAVFAQPALVYHSDSIGIKPILEVTVALPGGDTPSSSEARLTWNGSAQSWVNFTNPSAGDNNWVYGLQVSSTVTTLGAYPFTIDVKEHFANDIGDVVRSYSGTALVVVNDGAYGYGWFVSGLDRLVSVSGGMMLVYGSGGARLFTGAGPSYTSPANDYGTLVRNGGGDYTYTSKWQDDWNFDSAGKLTSIVDPHGLTRTFTYSNSLLSTVAEADGGLTTFTYSNGKLATIVQPGSRTLTFTYASDDLTNIADADGALRSFTYSSHKLTNEAWDTFRGTMTYSGTTGALTNLDRGGGNTLAFTDSAGLTLNTNPLKRKGDVNTSFTDSSLTLTTVTLDIAGRMLGYSGNIGGGGGHGGGVEAPSDGGTSAAIVRDAAGNITKYTDALSRVTTYTYDGSGDLTQVQHPDSSLETFTYDATFHTLLTHKDTLSNLTTFTYNGTGDLTTIKDALGKLTTFTYTNGQVETVKDALNNVTTYTYDSGRLQTVKDALTRVTTYSYDSAGNVETIKDALGRLSTFAYDAKHRLTRMTDALNGVATFVYDARGNLTSVTDPLSRITNYAYNAQGFNTTVTEAVGSGVERTTTYTYLAIGWVSTVKDALNHVTTYTYTVYGDVATITDPLNHTTTYAYDNERQITTATNALSQTTTYTYNNRGWLTQKENALNYFTTYTYDTEGNLLTIKDANSGVTTLNYDALNRATSVKDPLTHLTTVVYDDAGNVKVTIDALSNRTTYSYDALNRLETVKDAGTNVTTYVYDEVGNLIAVTDPLSHTTTYVYDELHRRVNTIEANTSSKTTFVYDAASQLINLIDPNSNKTTFIYDALGRQTTEIDPLSKRITYTYDAADRLTQKKDRLTRTIDYSYDDADRLIGEVWKNSGGTTTNTATYTFDNADRLLTARDGQGAHTFTYDAVGQVLTQKDMWSNTLTFTYDGVGNRTKVQDSLGGLETSTYDAANRLTARKFSGVGGSSLRLEFTYTNADQVENVKRYNASSGGSMIGQTTYTYDSLLRMSGIKSADGSANVLSYYTYTYDAASRLTAEILGGTTVSYDYDVRNQLTNDSVKTYTYDAAGNRTSNGSSIGTGNRLQSDNDWTYTYDDEGNLTRKVSVAQPTVTWTYAFDVKNRMTSAIKSGGGNELYSVTYAYDVFDNRIQEQEDADGTGGGSAVTTRFALEGFKVQQDTWQGRQGLIGMENWDVWADLDGSNNLKMRYVRGDAVDELFSRVKSDGTVAWYLTDRMNSVRQMTDAAGAVQDTIAYDGFGNITSESAPAFGDRYKWTGRERNATMELQYNRARYFSDQTGRWMGEDPIRFASGDYNASRYAFNVATAFVDPSGYLPFPKLPKRGQGQGPGQPPPPGQGGIILLGPNGEMILVLVPKRTECPPGRGQPPMGAVGGNIPPFLLPGLRRNPVVQMFPDILVPIGIPGVVGRIPGDWFDPAITRWPMNQNPGRKLAIATFFIAKWNNYWRTLFQIQIPPAPPVGPWYPWAVPIPKPEPNT